MGARASREAEQPSDEGDRQTDTAVRINSPHHLTSVPSLTVLPCSYPLVLENYLCFSFKTAATSPPKQLFLQPPVKGTSSFPVRATSPSSPQGWCSRLPDLSSSPHLQLGTGLSTFRLRRHNGTDPHPAGRKVQSCCLCSGRSGSRT